MEALIVNYVHSAPAFVVVPSDHVIIRRMHSMEHMRELAKNIDAGHINQVTFVGPAVCVGWSISVHREVRTVELPTIGWEHAIEQRQALMRIRSFPK